MAKDNENREVALEEREALLEGRASELSAREAAADGKESDLSDKAVELDQREKALNEREQALDEREKALTKLEATLEAAGGKRVLQVEEKRAGHAFSFRGRQYQFADDCWAALHSGRVGRRRGGTGAAYRRGKCAYSG